MGLDLLALKRITISEKAKQPLFNVLALLSPSSHFLLIRECGRLG